MPRFFKRKIEEWIVQIEESEEEIEVPDAEVYCQGHFENMPSAEGLEKGAFHPLVLDSNESQKSKDVQK